MEFENSTVGILNNEHFDASGQLLTKIPVIVLFYSSHCPHCKRDIPGFIDLASRRRVFCAAVPMEGPSTDTKLLQRLDRIVSVRTVPTFALFKNGRYVSSARHAEQLMNLI